MKRTIIFLLICGLTSFGVSGQTNPVDDSVSADDDTTKVQSSVILQTIKLPANKGFNFSTGANINFRQPGEIKRIRLDTLFIGPASYYGNSSYIGNSSYNYKSFEIGVTYRDGLSNTIKTNYITTDNMRGLKVGVSAPFNFR
jgi:hypothetical protein